MFQPEVRFSYQLITNIGNAINNMICLLKQSLTSVPYKLSNVFSTLRRVMSLISSPMHTVLNSDLQSYQDTMVKRTAFHRFKLLIDKC